MDPASSPPESGTPYGTPTGYSSSSFCSGTPPGPSHLVTMIKKTVSTCLASTPHEATQYPPSPPISPSGSSSSAQRNFTRVTERTSSSTRGYQGHSSTIPFPSAHFSPPTVQEMPPPDEVIVFNAATFKNRSSPIHSGSLSSPELRIIIDKKGSPPGNLFYVNTEIEPTSDNSSNEKPATKITSSQDIFREAGLVDHPPPERASTTPLPTPEEAFSNFEEGAVVVEDRESSCQKDISYEEGAVVVEGRESPCEKDVFSDDDFVILEP